MMKKILHNNNKHNIQIIALTLTFVLATIFAVSCTPPTDTSENTPSYIFNTPGSFENPTATAGKKELSYTDITLLNAGDIMYHNTQLKSAYNSSTGKYDFSNDFKYMQPIVSAADYAVVNFETTSSELTIDKFPSIPNFQFAFRNSYKYKRNRLWHAFICK